MQVLLVVQLAHKALQAAVAKLALLVAKAKEDYKVDKDKKAILAVLVQLVPVDSMAQQVPMDM
jgi:hypothetical protein